MSALFLNSSRTLVYSILLTTTACFLLLGSCTSTSTAETVTDSTDDKQIKSSAQYGLKEAAEDILKLPYDTATLSLLLEAEVSAYRGNLDRAVSIYAHTAQKHQDAGLAKRYTEIAVASENAFTLLDSTLLWYELEPENVIARQLSIRALARMGEVEGAWELVLADPDNHLAVRILAAETFRAQYTPQMLWLTDQITGHWGPGPESVELLAALSMLSEGTNQMIRAINYAKGAAALEPANPLPVRLQVRSLMKDNQAEEAVEVITRYIDNGQASAISRVQLARTLASIDPEAALPIFVRLADEYPDMAIAQLGAAELLLGQARADEAEKYYLRLVQLEKHVDIAHFNLGRIAESRSNLTQARSHYQLVGPGELEFEAKLRALLSLSDSNHEQVSREFDALRDQFPEQSISLYQEQGRLLASHDRPKQAIEVFSEGLSAHPNTESLLYARSVVYEKTNNVSLAIADLRTVLAVNPENISAMNALGYTLANRTNQYNEAYALIKVALENNPNDPAIIDSMGWVLYRLGRYEESLQHLAQAHQSLFDIEIVSHLLEVLVALDRVDDAKRLVEVSLEKLPNNETLHGWKLRL